VAGEHKGFLEVFRITDDNHLKNLYQGNHLTGNIFKIVTADRPGEFAMGTEKGLWFATWNSLSAKCILDENQILRQKNVSQVCRAAKWVYVAACWMESGLWLIDRQKKCVRSRIQDPRCNFKTTDLRPLFEGLDETPYML
jgi:hypothetical protein